MKLPEYDRWDATEMARLVATGELAPIELLEAAVERIEARNPAINAVVETLLDRARTRVEDLPDGPFRGVPFLVKDLKLTLAGTTTTGSTRLGVGRPAEESTVVAQRYEEAGLVVLGKTNTPEFGLMGITEPALRGPCRNPWNLDHTPGGSSGGSAAAVAARIVPAAHGGDGGGSIRIPSSACGLFGLKPTRGRVTMAPFLGEDWSGLVSEHVLTRSVRDSAAMLDIVDRPTPGEPYAAPPKVRPFAEEVGADPGRLRIAFTDEPLFVGERHPDTTAAVADAVDLLRSMGHELVEARPDFPREDLVRAYFHIVVSHTALAVEQAAARVGVRPRARDFEPTTWLAAQIGWKTPAPDLVASQRTIHRAARGVATFFESHDLFLTPTLAAPPARVGSLDLSLGRKSQLAVLRALDSRLLLDQALENLARDALARTPNTQLFNQTGQPACSVPLYWSEAGLPIGVQLAAPFGDEATLLRVAARLEEARPWADRLPPGLAGA